MIQHIFDTTNSITQNHIRFQTKLSYYQHPPIEQNRKYWILHIKAETVYTHRKTPQTHFIYLYVSSEIMVALNSRIAVIIHFMINCKEKKDQFNTEHIK